MGAGHFQPPRIPPVQNFKTAPLCLKAYETMLIDASKSRFVADLRRALDGFRLTTVENTHTTIIELAEPKPNHESFLLLVSYIYYVGHLKSVNAFFKFLFRNKLIHEADIELAALPTAYGCSQGPCGHRECADNSLSVSQLVSEMKTPRASRAFSARILFPFDGRRGL